MDAGRVGPVATAPTAADVPLPRAQQGESTPEPRTFVIRPTAWQADHAYRFVPTWISEIRASAPERVVLDLSQAEGLDAMSTGVLLARCRDVARVPVVVTGARAHHVETLRSLDLLAGAEVVPTTR